MVSTSVVLVATGLDVPPYAVSNQVLVDSFNTCLLYTSPSPRD